jgi:hypothetical protein
MGINTINAFMARGLDSHLANALSKKYTLATLKQLSRVELIALGLSEVQVTQLHSEPRPAIPEDRLVRVLHKNRRTCCICRDQDKAVIVHHISEWAVSRSHDESNLSVLCQEHHDLAHTTKRLTQNLSEAEIRESKKQWEQDVLRLDARTLMQLKNGNEYARWDWINLQRLFQLVLTLKMRVVSQPFIENLRARRIIDSDGILLPHKTWDIEKEPNLWFLDFMDGFRVAHYLGILVDHVLTTLPIIDITSYVPNKGQLKSLLKDGDYIAAQLPFYFKTVEHRGDNKAEIKKAYYKGHGVRIEYVFDAWYCLSCSARIDGMTGRKVQTVFGQIRSITDEDGDLVVNISCLASGTAFDTHVARDSYLKSLFR